MDQTHGMSPLLAVPNEVLYEIAGYLPRPDVISLQMTCHSFHLPLLSLLISQNKNEILLFAAERGHLALARMALAAGADVAYNGGFTRRYTFYRDTALHRAAAGGHTAVITELLRYNPPLEDRGGGMQSPLYSAAWGGHQAAVDLLLAAGCNPNGRGGASNSTLLFAAITSDLEPTAIAFIAQTGECEFKEAIRLHRITIATLMFARGIAKTLPAPLHIAAGAGVEAVELCLANGARINSIHPIYKSTALSAAVGRGNMDVVKYLLGKGAGVNLGPKKFRPIMNAVYHGNTEMVKLLLEHGVDLTGLRNPYADVLVSACVGSPPALVTLLLDAGQGLEVNGCANDDRKPGPLHVAAENGNTEVIKLLLERGAELDARRGPKWETPLHWAARATSKEAVEVLLKAGADPKLKCNGSTPLLMANRSWGSVNGRGRTMAALVQGGADINELGAKSRSVVHDILEAEELKQRLKEGKPNAAKLNEAKWKLKRMIKPAKKSKK